MNPEKPIKNITIIQPGASKCQLCGKVDELRPYGPNGEFICFDCGEKDKEATTKRFIELLSENDAVVIFPQETLLEEDQRKERSE